jgi:hypothetical protein
LSLTNTQIKNKSVLILCQAVWALIRVCEGLGAQHMGQFVDLVKKLARGEWFTSKTSACGMSPWQPTGVLLALPSCWQNASLQSFGLKLADSTRAVQ